MLGTHPQYLRDNNQKSKTKSNELSEINHEKERMKQIIYYFFEILIFYFICYFI